MKITENKRDYMFLLLVGDEQENMIYRYLDRGEMYAFYDDGLKGICVVTDEGEGILEIKNIAVFPGHHRQGYGRRMLEYISDTYKDRFSILTTGTADSPLSIPFYENYGFERWYTLKDFFTENYDHPIYECGVLLQDMIYLRKELK